MPSSDFPYAVRNEFPSLQSEEGRDWVFGDAALGSQTHESVIKAMSEYLSSPHAHFFNWYPGGRNTVRSTRESRELAAELFNCQPEEVIFGPNMTSLTFMMARTVAKTIDPSKNILVSYLCHDGNVSPWVQMSKDCGAELRAVRVNTDGCTMDFADFERKLDENTAFVALGFGSNSCGTISPVKDLIKRVKAVNKDILVYVDAVHFAPHRSIDVKDLGCDFLVCSPFKFFGPHSGLLFGRASLLTKLRPSKLKACVDTLPSGTSQASKWETGTANFEGIAGIGAVVRYICSIGNRFGTSSPNDSIRSQILAGYDVIQKHEATLTDTFLRGVRDIPGLKLFGQKDLGSTPEKRTPTFAIRLDRFTSAPELMDALLDRKIICGAGHFYAIYVVDALGLERTGGYVRIGFVHYNTVEEVQKVVDVLKEIAQN